MARTSSSSRLPVIRWLTTRALVAVILLGFAAPVAKADPGAPPPTLTDEHLTGTPEVELNCNPSGTSSGSFTVSGVAAGPYPGTFQESGTFSFNAGTPQAPGQAVSFQASFTIDSEVGWVTGTKELRDVSPAPVPEAFCLQAGQDQLLNGAFPVRYEATIATPAGSFADRGFSTALLQDNKGETFQSFPGPIVAHFHESFQSDLRVTEEVCEDDSNSQGDCDQDQQ
jgi:hypothetical protein